MDLLKKLQIYKKMDQYERVIAINSAESEQQRQMLSNLLNKEGELERVEGQLK